MCFKVNLWDKAESDVRPNSSSCLRGWRNRKGQWSRSRLMWWWWCGGKGGGWVCRLPERGARRGRWKRVGGPATAPPGTVGMTPTRLGCWDIEQALWAHLWKEEEEEWSEEGGQWMGRWLKRQGGGDDGGGWWCWCWCASGGHLWSEVASSHLVSFHHKKSIC